MTVEKKEEKKGIDVADWVKLIGYVAAILVASTSLLSSSGYIPPWWFDFSLIFLIGLIFSVPVMIFAKPISKTINRIRLERKRNAIVEKHFLEFENLVETARRFKNPISDILSNMRAHYLSIGETNELAKYALDIHNDSEISSAFLTIQKELDESEKTYRDLSLIMKQFELVLQTYKKYLKTMEAFAHDMMSYVKPLLPKGIEDKFETFREQYNLFVKDLKSYCTRVNQELGEREFPEWAVDHINKW